MKRLVGAAGFEPTTTRTPSETTRFEIPAFPELTMAARLLCLIVWALFPCFRPAQ